MTDDTRLEIDPEAVAWREADGEMILLDLRSSTYLAANPAASALWQRLAEGATVNDLAGALIERFGLDQEQAATDAEQFVENCRTRGLVRTTGN